MTKRSEKDKFIERKIKKINKDGIRGKTPTKGQAYAVARSYADKK